MSKLVEKLAKKIKEDLGIEVDPNSFISIRPAPNYKAAGAWSWEMTTIGEHTVNGIWKVGSQWTATECAKSGVKLFSVKPHSSCWLNEMEIVPDKCYHQGSEERDLIVCANFVITWKRDII